MGELLGEAFREGVVRPITMKPHCAQHSAAKACPHRTTHRVRCAIRYITSRLFDWDLRACCVLAG